MDKIYTLQGTNIFPYFFPFGGIWTIRSLEGNSQLHQPPQARAGGAQTVQLPRPESQCLLGKCLR